MKKKINYIFLFVALIMSCDKTSPEMSQSDNGKGGSMACFAISGNYLYTIDNEDITVFDISDLSNPMQINKINVGWNIETIYPYNQTLFLGSRWGMYIYDISSPSTPVYVSEYNHIYSCDPVVVDSNYAYVTLSSENICRSTNELQIIDISNLNSPELITSYNMESPKGLGISDTLLFVCDNGLKIFDASNVNNIVQKFYFGIPAYDVIPLDSSLIVTGEAGIYQYSFANDTITQLSLIQSINN